MTSTEWLKLFRGGRDAGEADDFMICSYNEFNISS